MAWDEAFTCDICGKPKQVANHWWMARLEDVPCCEEGQRARGFTLLPWNAEEARNKNTHHLCGEGCALKALERFMSRGTLAVETFRPTDPA
ncbi:MAG: hypothetical protein ACP5EP_07285 [Acidobacteriaceae bacterium]